VSANTATSMVVNELADMLKTNEMTAVHAQRLCMHYLRLAPRDDASGVAVTADTLANLPAPLHLLRHPQMLKLCVKALIHPQCALSDAATGGAQRVAKLLALACVVDDGSSELPTVTNQSLRSAGSGPLSGASDADLSQLAAQVRALEADLLQARALCSDVERMAYGVTSFEKPAQLIELMTASPLVSMMVLRWIEYHVKEGPLRSNSAFLSILPFFFQMIVTATQRHPLQRPDCFSALCATLALSSLANPDEDMRDRHMATDRGTYTLISVHENALECIVFLIGTGYTIIPISYLARQAPGLDAVLLMLGQIDELAHGRFERADGICNGRSCRGESNQTRLGTDKILIALRKAVEAAKGLGCRDFHLHTRCISRHGISGTRNGDDNVEQERE